MVGYDGSKRVQLSEFWQGVAGSLSGMMTRFIAQPLDVIKIRFQLQHEPVSKVGKGYYVNIFHAVRRIVQEESLQGLWKGHVPAQILSGVYGLAQFGSFEFLTKAAHSSKWNFAESGGITVAVHFVAGSCAGAIATVVSMPFDTLRTRLVGQGEPKLYNGLVSAISSMVRNEGVLSLFKGLGPTLVQIVPYAGIQFSSFNLLTQAYYRLTQIEKMDKLPISGNLICGSLSGLIAKVFIYPLDLTKKRLQVQGFESARIRFGQTRKYSGGVDCIKKIVIEEGFFGLYKGLTPSLIKAMVVSSLSFTLYEEISYLFSNL